MTAPRIVRTGERCMFCDVEIVWLTRAEEYQHRPPPGQAYGYFKCRGVAADKRHWARPRRWAWWRIRWTPPKVSGT